MKNFSVMAATWAAKVTIHDADEFDEESIYAEVVTRAVEHYLGRTPTNDDVILLDKPKIDETESFKDEMLTALTELAETELIPGCGIGTLILVCEEDTENLRCISSNIIFQNIGCSQLMEAFKKKNP